MKCAAYLAWILLCEACKFGEKICYSNWNNEFYLSKGLFFIGAPTPMAADARVVWPMTPVTLDVRVYPRFKRKTTRAINIKLCSHVLYVKTTVCIDPEVKKSKVRVTGLWSVLPGVVLHVDMTACVSSLNVWRWSGCGRGTLVHSTTLRRC